jgi:hypothetical protein
LVGHAAGEVVNARLPLVQPKEHGAERVRGV